MFLIDQLVEKHIQQAQARGEFDNLPGEGKPLVLEDDSLVPETLRAGFRLLKNAGYLPPELQINQEIKEAEQLLACVQHKDAQEKAERRLHCLQLRLNQSRDEGIDFVTERRYQEKLLQRL